MIKAFDIYVNFIAEHSGLEPSLEQFLKLGYKKTAFYDARNEFKKLKEEELKK